MATRSQPKTKKTTASKAAGKRATAKSPAKRAAAPKTAAPKAQKTAKPSSAAGRNGPARRRRESKARRAERAHRILAGLMEQYPEATTALHHGSALDLLVATILSAQCTDERVNMVMPGLMRLYPDAAALAAADQEDLETVIRSTGFYRNKAKNLRGMARILCEEFDGRVPDNMDDLLRLPGVARKTANCVLGTWFRKNVGIVVDTHVGRLAERLGLLDTARNSKDAERIETDLMPLFPQESWTALAHALVWHGRRVCKARNPDCAACTLAADCPSAGKV